MLPPRKVLELLLTISVILLKVITYIASPLWQDSLKPKQTGPGDVTTLSPNFNGSLPWSNSTSPAVSLVEQIDPYFCVLSQALATAIFWGIALVMVKLFFPGHLGQLERNYPQKLLFLTGASQTASSLLINYSLSGTRTAPYLISLLANFLVPLQFSTRLIIIRKRPTLRKLLCAITVVIGEFICLIPSVFPGLESDSQQQEDGGATGPGKILWPLCFVIGLLPGTMVNAFMEKEVKDKRSSGDVAEAEATHQLNIIFYLFWFGFWSLVSTLLLFWIGILPGFGTVPNISIWGERMLFNFACLVGQRGCTPYVYLMGWATTLTNVVIFLANAYMLRYTEGANYMTIALTLRSPLLLLFWTLFDENPFQWHPHVHLTTWLSIGALLIMVPAVHIYNTGAPEVTVKRLLPRKEASDKRHLLADGSQRYSINSVEETGPDPGIQ